MGNGFSVLLTFASNPDIDIWEKTDGVTPPGADGGQPISCDTMFNTEWMVERPRVLKKSTDAKMTVAYDPSVLDDILTLINTEDVITVSFPAGDGWAFYGFLQSFIPNQLKEGEQPTAVCTIKQTNWDFINGVEEGPVYFATI
jgi:hypothetical protein